MDSKSKPGWGSWLVLGVLIGLLCLAIVVLYVSWDPEQSGAMTGAGYVAMTLGHRRHAGAGRRPHGADVLQQSQRSRLTQEKAARACVAGSIQSMVSTAPHTVAPVTASEQSAANRASMSAKPSSSR